MIKHLFNRNRIVPTLVVILALGVMIRLGIWQLNRLDQRRLFNAHYMEQISQIPLELTPQTIEIDLKTIEYREIYVSGVYDFRSEVAIRNQSWQNQAGVNLLTPLKISGSDLAIFVDRGWIPLDAYQSGNWKEYSVNGEVNIHGIIRNSQLAPPFGGRPDPTPKPGEILKAWNFTNIQAISQQIPYPIADVYIQQSPDSSWTELPHPSQPEIEVSEGSHLSYAIQWFTFSAILGFGYPILIRREKIQQK
jgi:surfeit locus 1 family protein